MQGCPERNHVQCHVYSGDVEEDVWAAISHSKGVIKCHKKKTGSHLWVQGNCPVQNSACMRNFLAVKNAERLKIPARSADINCIELFFHRVKVELEKQALDFNVTRDTYE